MTDVRPTVLLTGATGQVGHELRHALAPLARLVTPGRETMDLASPDSIRHAVRAAEPALIINAAAYTAVDRAESEPELCNAINGVAPGILAEEAALLGAPLIHYSTDYVFDGRNTGPYTEADAPAPLNVYGRTKLLGEQAVAATGVPHLIFRTSWVYGRHGHNFMNSMLRLARERAELRIVADQFGAPTWSRSIAQCTASIVARLLGDSRGPGPSTADITGIYHLTAAGRTSWHGFASAVLELDPRRAEQHVVRIVPIPATEYPTAALRPANSMLCSDHVAERLGLRIPDWREGLMMALGSA